MLSRRGLIRGLGALIAAPAIVRASSLMTISLLPPQSLLAASDILTAEMIRRVAEQLRATQEEWIYQTMMYGTAVMYVPKSGLPRIVDSVDIFVS